MMYKETVSLTQDDVLDVIQDFPITPAFSKVVVTLNRDDQDLQLSENILSETQFVVSVGPNVSWVKPGQKVLLDLERLMVNEKVETEIGTSYQKVIRVKPILVNEQEFAIIEDRIIEALDNR